MHIDYRFILLCSLLCVFIPSGLQAAERQITSPDGHVIVTFILQEQGVPAYRIAYMDEPIVLASRLGLEPDMPAGFEVTDVATRTHAGQWLNEFGQCRIVPDNYSEMTVALRHSSGRRLAVIFRAYNEGAALRYQFDVPQGQTWTFAGERTEFRFPPDTFGYEAHGTEGEYHRVGTGDIEPFCERPLTLEYESGFYTSLSEAANTHYPRMLLSPLPDVPGALVSALGGATSNTDRPNQRHDPTITAAADMVSPWRVFIVGRRPGDLLERSYLILNLNAPSALSETDWIKPGKVMRDMTLTTANAKAVIDFAPTAGLQYVHLDARWYGSEGIDDGDAAQARAPGLDIQEILRYGRDKGVGLLVYVDRRQIRTQRDIIFELYEKWGIKGVKLGFVEVGPQVETARLIETVQKAAEHHLMLNIHDGYRAGGINRTWPNLMTVEGIRGNEHMPTPEHNCTLPFTRYVGGIGDYTVCYYSDRIQTTHAHQLAMAVVSFSPLQWLFWYDRPDMYDGEPEIEFFRRVPTVWDETRVPLGRIGEYAAIARRSGSDWFVGVINNSRPRQLRLPLTFLERDKSYTAHIYRDDDAVQTKTKVGIQTRMVTAQTVLDIDLKAAGGQAVWLEPD